MGGVNESKAVTYRKEGVKIEDHYCEDHRPEKLDAELAQLEDPWIASEGPLEADVRRASDGAPRHLRGLAFDATTTVVWDEDWLRVIRAAEPQPGLLAREQRVFVRERFHGSGLRRVVRVDYLEKGRLRASRYLPGGDDDATA